MTVSFLTKQHVFMANFSLTSNLRQTVWFFSWHLGEESVVESHQGAINVHGFPLFLGRGSGYIHVCLSLCDVIAASFFLFHFFLSFLSVIHHNWPIGTTNNWVQVFMLAAPSFPPSFPSLLSLASSAICLPVCLEFNWNIVHMGK